MSIIDFHKNNEVHQHHKYNYDIPFSHKIKKEDQHNDAPKEHFVPQKGQFSFKGGASKKHYMKFT